MKILVGVSSLNIKEKSVIFIYRKNSEPVCINAEDIPIKLELLLEKK